MTRLCLAYTLDLQKHMSNSPAVPRLGAMVANDLYITFVVMFVVSVREQDTLDLWLFFYCLHHLVSGVVAP